MDWFIGEPMMVGRGRAGALSVAWSTMVDMGDTWGNEQEEDPA